MFIYTSIFPYLKAGIVSNTSLSLIFIKFSCSCYLDKRVKEPKTPATLDITSEKSKSNIWIYVLLSILLRVSGPKG